MTLSVVIVNYNVKYFLEQCLESVYRSDLAMNETGEALKLEVYVVDNASVDGSVAMVRERFPQVVLIDNADNVGFARANNQALRIIQQKAAQSDASEREQLCLLLNPDTVVERDTFARCAQFYATHPDCGGLGVKMINGEGQYLKESKRGFPSPQASFYKLSGLIRLFPHSRRIAAYYMGHLSEDETNPIEILPGAYLMISLDALNAVGLLDETYFMYGEDIDFSWRIRLAGYQNYYFPEARIIHYKGESTRHGSMNYVYTFYNAMAIFVGKYFSGNDARLFRFLLRLAIWARASLSFLQRIVKAISLPIADFAIAFGGFVAIKQVWATTWAANINYYPPEYTFAVIPLYILILMASSWLYGGYEKPLRLSRIAKGIAIGSAILLVFYSLLDESQRYSRALLLIGCLWTMASTLSLRIILGLLHVPGFQTQSAKRQSCIVVGSKDEAQRVSTLYQSLGASQIEILESSAPSPRQIADMAACFHSDEIVFCSRDIPVRTIIDIMTAITAMPGMRHVEYKIAPDDSDFIIGSNSIRSTEDLYTEEINAISLPLNRRNKRIFNILATLFILLASPILFWFQHRKRLFFPHCMQVLLGQRSWVGCKGASDTDPSPVFGPQDAIGLRQAASMNPELVNRINLRYARNYHVHDDLRILFRNILYL